MSDIYDDMFIDSYEGFISDTDRYKNRYTGKYSFSSSVDFVPINKIKSVFALQFGGHDFVADVTKFALRSSPLPDDRNTFGKYSNGTAREWNLDITAVFDGGSSGSLHDFLWEYSGYTTDFIIRPFQDFDPLTKKFYGGLMRIPHKPDIKIKAGEESLFDYSFKVIGQPTRADHALGILTGSYISEY